MEGHTVTSSNSCQSRSRSRSRSGSKSGTGFRSGSGSRKRSLSVTSSNMGSFTTKENRIKEGRVDKGKSPQREQEMSRFSTVNSLNVSGSEKSGGETSDSYYRTNRSYRRSYGKKGNFRARPQSRDRSRYRRRSDSRGTNRSRSSQGRKRTSSLESVTDGGRGKRNRKNSKSHMAYVLDTILKGQQKLAAATNDMEKMEVREKTQRLIDRGHVKKALKKETSRLEKFLKIRERERDEKIKLIRVKTHNNKYRRKAPEREVKRAKEALERRVGVKVTGKTLEEIRFFLSEALDVRDDYELSDEQLLTVMVTRTQGGFRADLIQHITLDVPISEVIEELQIFSNAPTMDRIESERAIEEYRNTKQGIKSAAKEVLILVRQYAEFLQDMSADQKEEEIRKLFKRKIISLLPVDEARKIQKELEELGSFENPRPKEILNVIMKREKQIDAKLINPRYKISTVRKNTETEVDCFQTEVDCFQYDSPNHSLRDCQTSLNENSESDFTGIQRYEEFKGNVSDNRYSTYKDRSVN